MDEDMELVVYEEQDEQKDKYITFQSGGEYYGLKIQYVNEIIVFQDITPVPETAEYIKGLINLRGKIIPVMDVRLRFGQEAFPYGDRTCIIVIQLNKDVVGLIVEQIAEVVEIPEENILPSPSVGHAEQSRSTMVQALGKVGDNVELILDPAKLLGDGEFAALADSAGELSAVEGDA